MADDDVAAGLSELERKLEALEQELQSSRRTLPRAPSGASAAERRSASSPLAAAIAPSSPASSPPRPEPAAPPTGAPAPPTPDDGARGSQAFVAAPPAPPAPSSGDPAEATRLVADARAELSGLQAHLEELQRFRDQLERSSGELLAEYDRLLTGLRATAEHDSEVTAAATGLDATVLDGMVTVDAGPFDDVASLAAFEQALASLPGARDVHVRTFERSHALIDVILAEAIQFGAALRGASAAGFSITRAVPGHVTVVVS